MVKIAIIFMFFVMLCNGSSVYRVGDSAGWAVIGNMDYNKWASSKSFQPGDTFLFQYNPSYHNVLQVSRSDFHTCDATSPIATYATGNDSIVIRSPGHYYFICGFMGHCQAGQKVDLRVPRNIGPDESPIPSPILPSNVSSIPEASADGPMAPGPSHSNGHFVVFHQALLCFGFGLLFIFI